MEQNRSELKETFINKHDRLVISAYTGYLMCDFDDAHKFIEETLGRQVFIHELIEQEVIDAIQKKLYPEWQRIAKVEK